MAVMLGQTFREYRQCKILKARHRTGVFRTWVGKHWGIPAVECLRSFFSTWIGSRREKRHGRSSLVFRARAWMVFP